MEKRKKGEIGKNIEIKRENRKHGKHGKRANKEKEKLGKGETIGQMLRKTRET